MTQLSDEQLLAASRQLRALTPDKLTAAYSGRPGCACGCRGQHYKAGETPNDNRQIARILHVIQKAHETHIIEPDANSEGLTYVPGSHFAFDTNARNYVIYL